MSKSKKGTDYSTLLIWSAALVTVVRYAAAFIASDMGKIEDGWLSDGITFFMGLSGFGMGILDVIGGTYLFDGWRRAMPATGKGWSAKFKVLTGFVFALIACGVMILVPFTESRVTHASMADVLGDGGWLTWWAVLVNVAPYLLIGGVAVGNQVVTVTGNTPENSGDNNGKNSENSGKFSVAAPRWNRVSSDDYSWIATAHTGEIQSKYGLDERTARNWRTRAQTAIKEKVQQ